MTLRDETEWVELVEIGCNRLAGADAGRILSAVAEIEIGGAALPKGEHGWRYGDGHSAARIVALLAQAGAH